MAPARCSFTMALTYLIFRRTVIDAGFARHYRHYRYLRAVRWWSGLLDLQRSIERTDPYAIAMSPEEANLKFPNVGDWSAGTSFDIGKKPMKTADDRGPGETFRHDAAPRCELCGRRMEREEIGPGPNEWDWICPKQEVHG
ncbi:MAG: hypothetical protein IH804_09815 [Planctomycetes bacterium]|nr:hypothetical protein [Planctomycetota bacterium]